MKNPIDNRSEHFSTRNLAVMSLQRPNSQWRAERFLITESIMSVGSVSFFQNSIFKPEYTQID